MCPMKLPKMPRRTESEKSIPVLPLPECPAKTHVSYQNGLSETTEGCNIFTHLWTTCMILRNLRKIWHGYPLEHLIYPAAEWLAAYHDIGKVTPAFVGKIYEALGRSVPWEPIKESEGGHPRNSEIILEEYGEDFAKLAGRHHGGACWNTGLQDTLRKPELGGPKWQQLRKQLMEELRLQLKLPDCDLKDLQKGLPKNLQPLMLGAVILADWLSSSMDLPKDAPLPTEKQLQAVIQQAGLKPSQWKTGLKFPQLFGFSENPLQQVCAGQAKPGSLYIIEAGMGQGKTEAALYLTYQLLEKKQANGLYFAMPTRLTSEKIYERLNRFLAAGIQNQEEAKAMLIHGEAWLNWILDQPDENSNGIQHSGSWFQSKKRALLAPYGAGTADQALLSVINVKHKDLRAFALAGKIIILDECHSYDCYTSSLIANLTQQIRHWGGTVIILSATLTTEARQRLIGYSSADRQPSQAYPLLTIVSDETQITEIPVAAEKSKQVLLRHTDDTVCAMQEALEHASRGEQVLWIENTVADAQNIYCQLQTVASGIELGLIHSRFPACIRREQESRWVNLLGKHGADKRQEKGRIVVGTQIFEQSLDIDADFLITRLAPGDMIFQRIGRLWRHESLNAVRPATAHRETLLLSPPGCDDPEVVLQDKEVFLPYAPYWMLRTYEIWKERSEITLPDDIRPMLEAIYRERDEEGKMQYQKIKMLEEKDHLECLAGKAQGTADQPENDESASTRINDQQEVQVLLLRKGNNGCALEKQLFCLFSDDPVIIPAPDAGRREKTETAAILMKNMIKVSEKHAPHYEDFPLEFLRHILWIGEPKYRPIRAAYVDGSGELLTLSGTAVEGKEFLSYHKNLGYCARKKEV
mgnify:CR=1 FL=1